MNRIISSLIPHPSALSFCGSSSVGRASAFQAEGREFEPRLPLQFRERFWSIGFIYMRCFRSSVVERILGKDEVKSSILFGSSIISTGFETQFANEGLKL